MNNINTEIFRAYDIRGTYPTTINEQTAFTVGKSYGSYLQEKYNKTSCIVSHDNRLSSETLTQNLIKGLVSSGINIVSLGYTTTPMNYYARYLNQMPGIMVTASHNPKDDNGFKMSFDGMINARGEMIEDFKNYTLAGNFKNGQGKITNTNITDKYLEYLKYSLKFGKNKRKVVIDPGNGATTHIIRKVFDNVFCNPIYINDISDGSFPNHHPDPAVNENLVQLQKAVKDNRADFGVAYDGDGDRIGVVMENGEILQIEHLMLIYIKDMINSVSNKTFLYDIKCSKVMEDMISLWGGKGICYRTGASYTQYKIAQDNLPFGGEYSGHLYFRDRDADCGSAIYASLRLLEILSKTNEKLSKLVKDFPKYYTTPEIKIPSDDNIKFNVVEQIKNYAKLENYPINDIDGVRITYTNGWVLVRASNTGPNLTFRAEATSEEGILALQNIYLPMIEKFNKPIDTL